MGFELQIFQIVVLVFSAIIHEYMHGWTANQMGDSTAKNAGRLTLNPIPHIDPIGSVLLPSLMISGNVGFVFGWAKPVPFNPYNLRDQKWGSAKVAAAGPLSNFIVALSFGLILRFAPITNDFFALALGIIVYINLLLMVFNLIPIPPLDGSKILLPLLPYHWQEKFYRLEQYGFIIILVFVYFGFSLILPIIGGLFSLITGQRIF